MHFPTGGQCALVFDQTNQWLHAQWSGFIDKQERLNGSSICWEDAHAIPCTHLLNDTHGLRGPLFDSLEWLQHVWLEQVEQRGLRWLAHVTSADTSADGLLNLLAPNQPLTPLGNIELQVFDNVADAKEWLLTCP